MFPFCNKCLIETDDLSDVLEETISIKSAFYCLGRSLRLNIKDLEDIRAATPSEHDAEKALQGVLLLWLDKKYNVHKFGPPTWRMLVEAVNKRTGGNDHELAKNIALRYRAGKNIYNYVEQFNNLVCGTHKLTTE